MEIIKKILSSKKGLISVIVGILVLAGGIALGSYGYITGDEINFAINRAAREEVDADSADRIYRVEQRIQNANFITMLFVKKTDEYNKMVEKYNELVNTTAQAVVDEINGLEVKTSLTSYNEYSEVKKTYNAVQTKVKGFANENERFGDAVKSKITNYNLVETYDKDLEDLLDSYAHKCSSCGGDGKNSRSCSYCNGRGKKLVTWYSHGDWGEKSYTSYKCTSCNGSGRKTYSCSYCKGGKIYNFPVVDTTTDITTDTTVDTNADTVIGSAY